METGRLIYELDPFIKMSVINHKNIHIENGVSLLLASLPIEKNGVYVCQYEYFFKYIYERYSDMTAVFFITDCPDLPDCPAISDFSSFVFLNCRLESFTNILSKLLLRNKNLTEEQNRHQIEQVWRTIMNTSVTDNGELLERLKRLCPYNFKLFISCILVAPIPGAVENAHSSQYTALSDFHDFFHETNMFIYDEKIVILYSQELRPGKTLTFSYKQFSGLLKQHNMRAHTVPYL